MSIVESPTSWDAIVAEGKSIVSQMKTSAVEEAWRRWRIGKLLTDWIDAQSSRADYYGDQVVQRYAQEVGLYFKTIYKCMAMVRECPSEDMFAARIAQATTAGQGKLLWYHLTDKNNPLQYGGPDGHLHHNLLSAEIAIRGVKKAVQRYADNPDAMVEARGTLIHIADAVIEIAQKIGVTQSASDAIELPSDAYSVAESEKVPTICSGAARINDFIPTTDAYLAWIETMNCCVCGGHSVAGIPLTPPKGQPESQLVLPMCELCKAEAIRVGWQLFFRNYHRQVMAWTLPFLLYYFEMTGGKPPPSIHEWDNEQIT